MAAGILAFYRSDSSRALRRALVLGAALVSAGAVVMMVSFLVRSSPTASMVASCAGVALVVAGTVSAVIGLQRIFANDACIVVRDDGIVLQRRGGEDVIAWDEVESIRFAPSEPPWIVIARRDGSEVKVGDRRFGGKDARALAAELDGMRRKASFHLLRR